MIYRFGDFSLDTDRLELASGESRLEVQPQVFALLLFLIENRERVVSKDEIFDAVWQGRVVSDGTLNARINAVRRALGDDGHEQALIRTFPRRGFRFMAEIEETEETPSRSATVVKRPVHSNPSIAVLPFENLSGDPEQDYFSNGMAIDLITDLAKLPELKVLSRNASFSAYRQLGDMAAVAEKLGASYVLEGSARKMGKKIRINVQLVDSLTGGHLWAERYDGELADIFEFQDRIREEIVSALRLSLGSPPAADAGRQSTANVEAYDLYLKGRERYFHYTPEGLADALSCLKAAIALDPGYADAYGYLSYFYTAARNLRFISLDDPIALAEQAAERAVQLAPDSGLANTWLGWVHGLKRDYEKANRYFEKALSLEPGLPELYTYYGAICIYTGNPNKALELTERALQMDSFAPPSWDFHVGQAYFLLRRYDEAIEKFEYACRRIPKFIALRLHMAVVYWEAGERDKAHAEIAAVLGISPDYTVATAADNFPYVNGEGRDRFLNGLEHAGLPMA